MRTSFLQVLKDPFYFMLPSEILFMPSSRFPYDDVENGISKLTDGMTDFYKSRKITFISCSHLRFRLCLVLAFLMTISKTACQNSIWIKFGDGLKNAILGSRTHFFFFFFSSSFFFLRDFSSPDFKHLSHTPISMKLRKRVLHIIPQGHFSRFLDFQNIFRKTLVFLPLWT